jgi:Homeodomain-like domain
VLTDAERAQLRWSHGESARLAVRAKIVLVCAEPGVVYEQLAGELGVTTMTVGAWRKRFARARCDGLADGRRSGRPKAELGGDRGRARAADPGVAASGDRPGVAPSCHTRRRPIITLGISAVVRGSPSCRARPRDVRAVRAWSFLWRGPSMFTKGWLRRRRDQRVPANRLSHTETAMPHVRAAVLARYRLKPLDDEVDTEEQLPDELRNRRDALQRGPAGARRGPQAPARRPGSGAPGLAPRRLADIQ